MVCVAVVQPLVIRNACFFNSAEEACCNIRVLAKLPGVLCYDKITTIALLTLQMIIL
jgi:hypothetical protein